MASTTITNDLTKQCVRLLTLCGCDVWRQNNGGVFDPTKRVFRKNSSTPGISDVIGFHKATGLFVACEVKVGKDELRKEQKDFLARVKQSGGLTMIVKDFDDAADIPGKVKRWFEMMAR